MQQVIDFILNTVGNWGYVGIFVMMFLESSFFPFPSEVVMIPAGYLAYKGEMDITLAFLSGVSGSLFGALFNYWIAYKMGRNFILRYGKYVFFTPKSLQKMESFFEKHGHISTFVGRLLPAVRQYISLPAGLCKMNLVKFCIFSALGAGIWVLILIWIGYSLGDIFTQIEGKDLFHSEALGYIKEKVKQWTLCVGIVLCCIVLVYWGKRYFKK